MPVPEYRVAHGMPETCARHGARGGSARADPPPPRRGRRAPLRAHGRRSQGRRTKRRDALRSPAPRPAGALQPRGAAYRRFAYESSARNADAVVVNSQFVRRSVIERLGVPPERIHTIPLGIDHDRFTPGDEERERFLLYPARPWPHKNHERLFEAFALLRQERPELRARADRRRPRGRPVPPGVVVEGIVSGEELVSLYRRAACLVFPACTRASASRRSRRWRAAARLRPRTSRRSPRRCGDAAALFDPNDPEDIAAVVAGVLDAPERSSPPASNEPEASPGRRRPGVTRPSYRKRSGRMLARQLRIQRATRPPGDGAACLAEPHSARASGRMRSAGRSSTAARARDRRPFGHLRAHRASAPLSAARRARQLRLRAATTIWHGARGEGAAFVYDEDRPPGTTIHPRCNVAGRHRRRVLRRRPRFAHARAHREPAAGARRVAARRRE